jgi:hypothetical protein
MGQATSYTIRQEIVLLRKQGLTLVSISKKIPVGFATIQRICASVKAQGEDGIIPKYGNCGKQRPDRSDWACRSSIWLRRLHPHWGAPLIHLKMSQKYPHRKMPSIRTLQYWFKWSNKDSCQNTHPKEEVEWSKSPHDVWQTDAKEQGKLLDKSPYCWLTITDEKTGGLIEAPLFPQ